MKRTLLAFSIATMALTTAADHLIIVKVGGKSFAAKVLLSGKLLILVLHFC